MASKKAAMPAIAAMEYKPPTDAQRVKNHARDAKVRATQDWVEGRITSDQHKNVHERANHVLAKKPPEKFKGKTGEKAGKKGMPW